MTRSRRIPRAPIKPVAGQRLARPRGPTYDKSLATASGGTGGLKR